MSERCSCGGPLPCLPRAALPYGLKPLSSPTSETESAAGPEMPPFPRKANETGMEYALRYALVTYGSEATIKRLTAEVAQLKQDRDCIGRRADLFCADLAERDATIERVQSLLGDEAGPLWSVRGVCEANLQAALNRRAQ